MANFHRVDPSSRSQRRTHLACWILLEIVGRLTPLHASGSNFFDRAEFADSWVLAPKRFPSSWIAPFRFVRSRTSFKNARALSYLYFCAADYQDSWE
jgi:hypothetical protein